MVYPQSYGWSISEQEIGPTYLEALSYTDSATLKFPKLQSLLYNTFKILPISVYLYEYYSLNTFVQIKFVCSLLKTQTYPKNYP